MVSIISQLLIYFSSSYHNIIIPSIFPEDYTLNAQTKILVAHKVTVW